MGNNREKDKSIWSEDDIIDKANTEAFLKRFGGILPDEEADQMMKDIIESRRSSQELG